MELPKSLIHRIIKRLPELCSVSDLMRVGIYRSEQAAYMARKTGSGPVHFRLPFRGIVYPRDGIIEYLQKHANVRLRVADRIQDAQISHSKVPPLRQK